MRVRDGYDRHSLQESVDLKHRGGRAAQLFNSAVVAFGKIQYFVSRVRSLYRSVYYGFQKKLKPRFPIAGLAHVLQQIVINITMGLEIQTEIQKRFRQNALCTEQKGYQEPAEPAVSV